MAFRSKLKIRFGDIDRAGIVYYPRFMQYFHVAMEEFLPLNWGSSIIRSSTPAASVCPPCIWNPTSDDPSTMVTQWKLRFGY